MQGLFVLNVLYLQIKLYQYNQILTNLQHNQKPKSVILNIDFGIKKVQIHFIVCANDNGLGI